MKNMNPEKFEPMYLQFDEPAKLTEYGKRWMDNQVAEISRYVDILKDVAKLGAIDRTGWEIQEKALRDSGVPTAISSGVSQYGMSNLIDHINGKTAFTKPTTVAMALGTAAPTAATTGVWGSAETTNYTGYLRQAIAGAGFNAATAASPSVATNNGAITFPACTASTATYLGFLITDNSTTNTGNALWYGSLTSVTISTTQTPPTVATTAMSLSMTGT